eukprot:CAMPEP_0179354284 /NCGR_PEP_ID=MMETSP0797-20121207/76769_1 /TAXON_ID=47934 /ORGANISM="Dinophysis acuminata, Strain DAEP01" /LENGTH=166 /DNA_ID=CAMNT_0021069377 /DNA_START=1 /DNA_END=497 /DNA_ORIENTATION=+
MSLVVVADTEEEEQHAREEILERAAWLQRFGLVEDGWQFAKGAPDDDGRPERPAAADDGKSAAVGAARDTGASLDLEYYIVVRAALHEAEALLGGSGRGGAATSAAAAEPLDEDVLDALLNVPDEMCHADRAARLPQELAIIDTWTHPALCAQLRDYLGDESGSEG